MKNKQGSIGALSQKYLLKMWDGDGGQDSFLTPQLSEMGENEVFALMQSEAGRIKEHRRNFAVFEIGKCVIDFTNGKIK